MIDQQISSKSFGVQPKTRYPVSSEILLIANKFCSKYGNTKRVANQWLVTQSLGACFCELHSPMHFVSLLHRSKLFPIL